METADHKRDEHQERHEWEEAAFDWEQMKEGIYSHILAEDPDFFKKDRRRGVFFWIWTGSAAVILAGLLFWFLHPTDPQPFVQPIASVIFEETPCPPDPLIQQPAPLEENIQASPLSTHSKTQVMQAKDMVPREMTAEPVVLPKEAPVPPASGNAAAIALLAERPLRPLFDSHVPKQKAPSIPIPASAPASELRWKGLITGGGSVSFSKYSGSSGAAGLRNEHTSATFGYSYGLEVWAPLSQKGLFLLAGLNRQETFQHIDITTERQVEVLMKNVLLEVTYNVVGDRTTHTYGDTVVAGTERNRLAMTNVHQFLQFEAGMGKSFGLADWILTPSAGLSTSILTGASGGMVAADGGIFRFGKDDPIFHSVHHRTWAGIALERKLSENLSVMARYRFDKQWNNASNEPGLVLRPAAHQLSAGLAVWW